MIAVLGPMLGPAVKLAAAKVRQDVQARGMDAVAQDYAATLRQLLQELPDGDRALVARVLEHLGPVA